jgi:hypothetical protein
MAGPLADFPSSSPPVVMGVRRDDTNEVNSKTRPMADMENKA